MKILPLLLVLTACGGAPFSSSPVERTHCNLVCNSDGTACACAPDGGLRVPEEGGFADGFDPTPPDAAPHDDP